METKLARITEIAKMKPDEKFTSLYHHINEEMLLLCHTELSGNKASGVDEVTKEEYESNLTANIKDLVDLLGRFWAWLAPFPKHPKRGQSPARVIY